MISEPAPRRSDMGSELEEESGPHAHVSELSFLRSATIVWSICFILLPSISRPGIEMLSGGGADIRATVLAGLTAFYTCALLGLAAITAHSRLAYLGSAVAAIAVYAILLSVHGGYLLNAGASPLEQLFLGDFVGLPATMLLLILPTVPGILTALALICVATIFNAPLPWDDSLYLGVAVGHAWLALAPFLIVLARMVVSSRQLDDTAMSTYRTAVRIARSARLTELETRFLAHVHDKVLADLRAVAAGHLSPTQLRPEPPQSLAAPPLPLHYVIMRLVGAAGTDTRVDVPAHINRSATVPAPVAAALLDVAIEAVANSRIHAPQASRSMRVTLDAGLQVEISDDGPGFTLADIPNDRAGVRNSILRTGEAVPGLVTGVETAPSKGTVVRVGWAPDAEDAHAPAPSDSLEVSSREMVGVECLIHPLYLTAVMLVFFSLAWVSDPSSMWLLAVAAVAVVALPRGSSLQLPSRPTGVLICAVLALVTGQQLTGTDFPDYWPHAWTLSAASILLSLLALRKRAGMAWATLGVLILLSAIQVRFTGAAPIEPLDFSATVSLLTPSSLIPTIIGWTVQHLPELQQEEQDQLVRLEETAARRRFVRESNRWLSRQIASVKDESSAALMEKRLRDAIRSPLLDEPEVTSAVWNARARGVKVQLIDDRSPIPAEIRRHSTYLETLVTVLRGLEPGETLTARLLPAGRPVYATLVTSEPRSISV